MRANCNPIAVDVPVGTPKPFAYKGHEYRTHLRYSETRDTYNGFMYVAIHTDSYGKSLPFLTAMSEHLAAIIPFPFTMDYEPEVEKLAGPCYSNMMSVQFSLRFTIDETEAVASLRKLGFYPGLEYVK
jgi:hypothetical protein